MAGRDETGGAAKLEFLELSAALTGFDVAELEGTGMLEPYLGQLLAVTGAEFAGRFVDAGARRLRAGNREDVRAALQRFILGDEEFGPVARALVTLWYTGAWYQLPRAWRERHGASAADETGFLSPRSYREGLAWAAAGTHPIAAKPTGFGSWGLPPRGPGGARS